MRTLRDRYTSLSSRDREVIALVVRGHLNKEIGREHGISEITVKAHRGHSSRGDSVSRHRIGNSCARDRTDQTLNRVR
jgi:FixJ family two-component response regulator